MSLTPAEWFALTPAFINGACTFVALGVAYYLGQRQGQIYSRFKIRSELIEKCSELTRKIKERSLEYGNYNSEEKINMGKPHQLGIVGIVNDFILEFDLAEKVWGQKIRPIKNKMEQYRAFRIEEAVSKQAEIQHEVNTAIRSLPI